MCQEFYLKYSQNVIKEYIAQDTNEGVGSPSRLTGRCQKEPKVIGEAGEL